MFIMEKAVILLRNFFRISSAAFNFTNAVNLALNGNISPSEMQQLHQIALQEIEKLNPDMSKIDNLLAEMERLAELNTKPKPNLPNGSL